MSSPPDSGNIFLTTASQMNRDMNRDMNLDMYSRESPSNETPPPTIERFQFDETLLVKKDKTEESSRLIHTLQEELSTMKDKMKFVIEKDKEIYRLQCELSLLQKSYETLQQTQVTDDSLLKENMKLTQEHKQLVKKQKAIQSSCDLYEEKIITFKKTIVRLHTELQEVQSKLHESHNDESSCVTFDRQVIKQALNPLHNESVNIEVDLLCTKYDLIDYQQINSSYLQMILSDIISHCKYL